MKRRKPLLRTSGLRRTSKLNPMSQGRIIESRRYSSLRKKFLKEHPTCQACKRHDVVRQESPTCTVGFAFRRTATDIHHVKGRLGGNYLDVSTWMAVCRTCHDWIHQHPKEARAAGMLK